MFPIERSRKFENLYFSFEVTSAFRENVEAVYEEFPYFHEKQTLVVAIANNENYDMYGSIYESTGILMYCKTYTSKLAAYAMFYNIVASAKCIRHYNDRFRHYSYTEIALYQALMVAPDNYITAFQDIPGFEGLGTIRPTKHQLTRLREVFEEKLESDWKYASSLELITKIIRQQLPPCSLEKFVGKRYQLEVDPVIQKAYKQYPELNDRWDMVVAECYTSRSLEGVESLEKLEVYHVIPFHCDGMIHHHRITVTIEQVEEPNGSVTIHVYGLSVVPKKE